MVEEDIDSDDERVASGPAVGHAVLRHIDSDDEADAFDSDGIATHPREPTHTLFSTNTPPLRAVAPSQRQASQTQAQPAELPSDSTFAPAPAPVDIEADPQRLQRWLLTSGLEGLKDKAAGSAEMQLYVRRLRILRAQQQQWVLSVVGQRGEEMKALVERLRAML